MTKQSKNPRTLLRPIVFDREKFLEIEPMGLLQSKEFSGIVPGLSLIGDYHYYKISTNYPISSEDAELAGWSVRGVTETKWIDQYTIIYGITKNELFNSLTVISEVRDIIQHTIADRFKDNGSDTIETMMENFEDILGLILEQKILQIEDFSEEQVEINVA